MKGVLSDLSYDSGIRMKRRCQVWVREVETQCSNDATIRFLTDQEECLVTELK